jgi:hypothetical protein
VIGATCRLVVQATASLVQADIGRYIKACTDNIARLDRGIPSPEQVAAGKGGMNATTMAHCHGVVRQAACQVMECH